MRRLLLILIPLLFVAPAYSQSSNPTPDPTCGLPKQGTIVESETYTLKANCTQTGALEIKTSQTSEITLTINGNNKIISSQPGRSNTVNFIFVDDDGKETLQNVDNSRSPNVKVIIKNVTFDGNDKAFLRPLRRQPDGAIKRSSYGAGILVDGTLTMENVTLINGNGIWVRAKGTASLTNVLFEDSWIPNFALSSSVEGVLYIAKTGSVTLNNAVFRDTARANIVIEKGGQLTTTGCLSFIRVWTHKVHYSGLYSGLGTWNDRSGGACTGTIGNQGQAVVAYTLPLLPCGLPSSGTIEGTVVYTLSQDCVCVNTVNIAAGASVTINGNDKRIEGCSSGSPKIRNGNAQLTINNANITGIRVYNYGGVLTLTDSQVTNAKKTPIMNYGWAYLSNSIFQDNTGSTEGKVYYSHGWFNLGRAIFRDNVFRNNKPDEDEIEAYTTGRTTAIYLCGENILDGVIPTAAAPFFMAVAGGGIFGCPGPGPSPTPAPVKAALCSPGQVEQPAKRSLGAIGVILYVEKCPLTVEIWEILPNSQGQFALAVSQSQIEAASEGLVACSANGRAAVRVGMTEPVRQIMAYSKTYKAPSERGGGARDILISVGPTFEQKVHHLVIDHALDGTVMGAVDTRPDGPPCDGADAASLQSAAAPASSLRTAPAPPPQPTPIPIAAPVTAQPAREDGSIVHVVQAGDTLWAIGVAYDVHPYRIISLNQLDEILMAGGYIVPGQELLIRRAS